MMAGSLRYTVDVQQQSTTRTGTGALQNTFAVFGTVRAAFEPLTGREALIAQKIDAQLDTKITIRYLAGILPHMRISWQDTRGGRVRIYDIGAILDSNERHHEMTLAAKELDIPANAGVVNGVALPPGFSRKNFAEAPDGVRTEFTLPTAPNPDVLQVYLGGAQLFPGAGYTLAGNLVTFAAAPLADDQIWAYY